MFAQVCVSSGGGVSTTTHPEGVSTRPSPGYMGYYRIRSTSGRYASYWNASSFLYFAMCSTYLDFTIWGRRVPRMLTFPFYSLLSDRSLFLNVLGLCSQLYSTHGLFFRILERKIIKNWHKVTLHVTASNTALWTSWLIYMRTHKVISGSWMRQSHILKYGIYWKLYTLRRLTENCKLVHKYGVSRSKQGS